jgi:uncharacterized protein YbjT (DUF2867 family)
MIVVTTPTGTIGRQVLARLLQAGTSVRVIAREPSRVPTEHGKRIEVVEGTHGDAETVARATVGADTVFWLVPPNPKAESVWDAYVGFTLPGLKAMQQAGVRRIVGITALGRGTPQAAHAGFVTGSLAMDDAITASGMAYRAVANPSFFDNLLRQVQSIRDKGVFFSAVDPARKLPGCATRDIATTAARWLLDPHWSGSAQVPVLGPQDLSFDDMAAVMSDVLGRRIECHFVDQDRYKAQFVRLGMSQAMAQGMSDMARAKSEGLDNHEPRTPQNSVGMTFEQWCVEVLRPAVEK